MMPERIVLTQKNVTEAAKKAADVLRQGGVVLYPTDTLYGLGVDSLNKNALEKVYKIKGRAQDKAAHSVFENLDASEPFVEVSPLARVLAGAFLPGPLTLLLAKKDTAPDWATAGYPTFGVRVPNNQFCLLLAQEFAAPYTSTSANRSGENPEQTVDAILAQLGESAKYIDLVIDGGEVAVSLPSTIVDVRGAEPVIVREAAIPAAQIFEVFNSSPLSARL